MNAPTATCPACQREIDSHATTCPFCFSPIESSGNPMDDQQLEAQIRQLLSSSEKIAAIKLYREATGLGLREAKDAVAACEMGQRLHVPSAAKSGEGDLQHWQANVLDLMRQGKKIAAIKIYREANGSGLKDAKEAVEKLAAENGIAPVKSGCLGVVLTVFVIVALGFMIAR